jgi:hypothetical protein
VIPVRYSQPYGVELSFKYKTGRWIMSLMLVLLLLLLLYHRHKPIDIINLFSWRKRNVFPVRYGQTYRVEPSFQ